MLLCNDQGISIVFPEYLNSLEFYVEHHESLGRSAFDLCRIVNTSGFISRNERIMHTIFADYALGEINEWN